MRYRIADLIVEMSPKGRTAAQAEVYRTSARGGAADITIFKSKTNDAFGDTTWNQLSKLLEPSYTIRGFDAKTPIHFEKDTPQEQKVSLTGEAYRKHISELNKCGFE